MKDKAKIAILGLGRRGYLMMDRNWSEMKDVEIKILCDPYEPSLQRAAELLKKKNLPEAYLTTDFDEAINHPDVDAVVILTGWDQHASLAEKALLAGKYAAVEVGCASSLQECFNLAEAHEKTGASVMMLENCAYSRREMMVLNIVKAGLFGEIVHCAGGYHHELTEGDLFQEFMPEHPLYGIPHYRIQHYIYRNCHNYPTHELGPIAKVLNIHHGNRMMTLSPTASKARGLNESAKDLLGEDSPYARMNFKQGDIVTTVITCAGGETITLTLDKEEYAFLRKMTDNRIPTIDFKNQRMIEKWWRGSLEATHYLVNPIHGDICGLAPISIFIGSGESLLVRKLAAKAVKQHVRMNYWEKRNAPHTWVVRDDLDNLEERKCIVELLINPLPANEK